MTSAEGKTGLEEVLRTDGVLYYAIKGVSMMPLIRQDSDLVVIKRPVFPCRENDVVLFKRHNGQYVLHRVIDFCRDGSYVMCGDNQFAKEKGIRDDQIIAVMTGFYRKGKTYSANSFLYRVYVNFWYYTRPFRHTYSFGKRKASRLFKKNDSQKDKE